MGAIVKPTPWDIPVKVDLCRDLARGGISTFQCLPNKAPACPGGYKAATTDRKAIDSLWSRPGNMLIGVPTGAVSGFDVLDLDLTKHAEACAWWDENCERIPATRMHTTKSGGLHLFFNHHEGMACSAGRVAPGVDVRADGGYVCWWPGEGLPHAGPDYPSPCPRLLADWPDRLLPLAMPPVQARQEPTQRTPLPADAEQRERYAEAALRRAVEQVATAPNGQRNDTLNAQTYSMARLVIDSILSARDVADAMAEAGLAAGLPPREVAATIGSALAAGIVA